MSIYNVDDFLSDINNSIEKYFSEYRLEILLNTPRSFKANIHIGEKLFIAVRYNARNERMDFALIENGQRIFGYDNLKEWHYHPVEDPQGHIPCDKPSIEEVISKIKEVSEKPE